MCILKSFMPKKPNLTKPVSVRLSPQVRNTVKDLADSTGLLQAQVYDLILRAGCTALEENGMRMELPLKFQIAK
jgi:hypothetical protein